MTEGWIMAESTEPSPAPRLKAVRRRPIAVAGTELVQLSTLPDSGNLPLVIEALVSGLELSVGCATSRQLSRQHAGVRA